MVPETIIALDPGIARTGYAVLTKENERITPKDYGCIETKSTTPLAERLTTIYQHIGELVGQYTPTTMVLERVFFNKNQKTAITVGQAQGIMLLRAGRHNMSVHFVTPLQIKQTLTGYGAADKKQVERMVMLALNLSKAPKLDDTADALACGLTYFYQNKLLLNA